MLADTTILAVIRSAAAQLGETAPSSMQYLRGSRRELNKGASGAGIGGIEATRPAVLVQAVGEFTRTRPGIVPKGVSPLKTYTVLILIIDDETGHTTDRGFGFELVDLAALGGVVDLTPENVLPESVIVDMIMREAAACNDPRPASIEYVYGTRSDLNRRAAGATFEDASGQAASVLVQATGSFSTPVLHGPVPYPDATGNAILLVIDQQTGNVTDQGITNNRSTSPRSARSSIRPCRSNNRPGRRSLSSPPSRSALEFLRRRLERATAKLTPHPV